MKTNFDRKIASIALQQIHFAEIRAAFGDVQLGCDSKGTEKIIHQFRVIREVDPTLDYSAPDAKNAFNNSNRMIGLHETLQRIPGMFPFVNFLYGQRSNTWFFGLDNGIESIASKEGSQQGCSLGNFLCGMAFLPFILGITLILNGLGISKFFVDDGNTVTSFAKMLEVLQFITQEGKKFGYIAHFGKGFYLLGRTGSIHTALDRKQQLVDLGFDPQIIKIHPDDMATAAPEDIEEFGLESIQISRLNYGGKTVGGYIGDDEYVMAQLRLKAEELEAEADRLIELDNPQQCLIFLRYCYGEKINHILRT